MQPDAADGLCSRLQAKFLFMDKLLAGSAEGIGEAEAGGRWSEQRTPARKPGFATYGNESSSVCGY